MKKSADRIVRCEWAVGDPLYEQYHDQEWGVPVHDDRKLFEFLLLEGAQAGLSWITILRKREGYRKAFCDFDPELVARLTDDQLDRLRQDPSIVRNRLKIASAAGNARAFLRVREEFGEFATYLWRFVDGRQIVNDFRSLAEIPATTKESDQLSKDLKSRGFKFVGSTICYAYMQAVGLVDDHVADCFRRSGSGP